MAVSKRSRIKCGRKVFRYQAEVYLGKVRIGCRTFETRAAAEAWHDETKRKAMLGQTDPGSVQTFGEVISFYRETAFGELRKSSQQARRSRFRFLEESPLADVLMRDLDARAVDGWLRWLREHETAKAANRTSFRQELKLLGLILRWYKNERDPGFVVPIVRRHSKGAHFKPVPVRQQDYYIRPHEVLLWLAELAKRPDPVYARLANLMILTGLRMGEAAGLCWDAVHLDDGAPRIRVIRTLSWDYRTKEPYFQERAKNAASIRTFPISGPVVQMLASVKVVESHLGVAAPVFRTNRGAILRDNTIRDNFNSAFKACKLPWSGTHIARHTFATLALIGERDLGPVQAALGHSTQRQTAEYAKVLALQSSQTSSKVADLLGLQTVQHGEKHVRTVPIQQKA